MSPQASWISFKASIVEDSSNTKQSKEYCTATPWRRLAYKHEDTILNQSISSVIK